MPAVRDVDLTVGRGEFVALLGESGSGKSVTARAIMGLLDEGAVVEADELRLGDVDLLTATEEQRRRLRGERVSLVLQDALSALNPVLTIGDQIGELVRVHRGGSKKAARARAIELLAQVGISVAVEIASTTIRTSSRAACASASSSRWRSRSSPNCSSPTSPRPHST